MEQNKCTQCNWYPVMESNEWGVMNTITINQLKCWSKKISDMSQSFWAVLLIIQPLFLFSIEGVDVELWFWQAWFCRAKAPSLITLTKRNRTNSSLHSASGKLVPVRASHMTFLFHWLPFIDLWMQETGNTSSCDYHCIPKFRFVNSAPRICVMWRSDQFAACSTVE